MPKFPSLAVEKLAPARTPKPYANELCVKENNRKASKRVGIVFIIRLILIVLEIKNNSKNETKQRFVLFFSFDINEVSKAHRKSLFL